jgi:hypothetical protein
MPITASLKAKSSQLAQKSVMEGLQDLTGDSDREDSLWDEVNNEWKEEGYRD